MDHKSEALDIAAEKARVDEIKRISQHFESHQEDCCCETYLGRHCCKAPHHGDEWRVNAISDGERFCYVIRAKDRKEAKEIGRDMCLDNGEECISVSKVKTPPSELRG
jgi:hypothetical protein